jgi:uncharacterized protein (TIGR00266 family)
MKVDILHQPSMAIAQVFLGEEEELLAQAGALIAMKGNIQIHTILRRGREGKSGEKKTSRSLFLNSFKAGAQGGELYLAPSLIGSLGIYTISQHKLVLRLSAYLASSKTLEIFLGFRDFKTDAKSKSSLQTATWLNLVGDGTVIVAAFGKLYDIDLEDEGEYIVNIEHIVAFESSLKVRVLSPSVPLWQFWQPKQEILCHFKGQGKIICQSHRPRAFAKQLGQDLHLKNFKLYRS